MRTFECVCDNVLFFENSLCTQCEREVGWCPGCDGMSPIEPAGTAWRCVRCETALLKCHNVLTALRVMLHEEVHHVYVLEDDVPVGVVSFVDALNCL